MQYSALYPAKKRGSIVKPTNEMVQIAPSILAPNGTKRFMKLHIFQIFIPVKFGKIHSVAALLSVSISLNYTDCILILEKKY